MDLVMTEAMLDRAKIDYKRTREHNSSGWREQGYYIVITVERGYRGFTSSLYFKEDGTLASIEAYE
jgi:hypothetical protein